MKEQKTKKRGNVMKKILSFALMVIMITIFTGTTVYAKNTVPKIFVNNKELKLDAKPYTKGKEIMVPVRKTVEALGAKVEYDNKSKIVRINMDDARIELPVGKKEFYVYKEPDRSKRQTFKLTVEIKRDSKGVTFVAGSKFFECLGIKFTWDSKKKVINITKPEKIDLTKDIPYTVITRDNIKDLKDVAKWYDDNYKKSGIRFKKHADVVYVLISAGKKPTGGYSVGIDKISYKTEKKAYVNAYVQKPAADMMVIQVETYPHMLIKITGNKQLNKVEGKIEEKKVDNTPAPSPSPVKVKYEEITFDHIKYNETLVKWFDDNYKKEGINHIKVGNYIYILIGAGEKLTGGYNINIDDVYMSSVDTLTIKAKVVPPASGSSVIMAITYPFKFIRVESGTIKNVVGEVFDSSKVVYDKWIVLEDAKIGRMELLDQDLILIRDITGTELKDIVKAFNEASVDDSFYIMMITGRVLKVTTTDGYVLTFTSYGSDSNVVVTIEKGQEIRSYHIVAPLIAKLLLGK